MAAPTSLAETFKITLANGEPSTHGDQLPFPSHDRERHKWGISAVHGQGRIRQLIASFGHWGIVASTMEETYLDLKGRWLAGERDRELTLQLMYLAWMHWADPPFVTGLKEDATAPDLWHQAFACLGGESSTDAEFLFVSGIMAELFPWVLGDETEWKKRGLRLQARATEVQPSGLLLSVFDNRGEYGDYFAHQLRGGRMQA